MFHFKKFSIDDSKAAMKIGTDAVLLGSWVNCRHESRILDIGTGSGILALMMAQRNPGTAIDAIELDSNAATLAQQNFRMSPWEGQITCLNKSFQQYAAETDKKYSLLICNPPFFTASLKTPEKARNLARHNDSLPVNELLQLTSHLLDKQGKAAFVFPADAFNDWILEAEKHSLYPQHITRVKSTSSHKPHRVLLLLSKIPFQKPMEDEISIYLPDRSYTKEYQQLTSCFYLNF